MTTEAELIAALKLVEFGSCDQCGLKNYCVVCKAPAADYENDYLPGLHKPDCAIGKAPGRCKPS